MNSNERNLNLASIAIRTAIKKHKSTEVTKVLKHWDKKLRALGIDLITHVLIPNLKVGGEWNLTQDDIDYFRENNRATMCIGFTKEGDPLVLTVGNVTYDW